MTLVHLENVCVDFPIYGAQRSLRSALFKRATGGIIERSGKHGQRVVVRALNDISFQLRDGDRLGLIGHNGSGKSTLLKALAGIYQPVSGRISVQGRVTPLLDTMPGLDPEDTGYENLLTAGLLLGMSRQQVEEKIPEIEEFSELGEYLSLPVRTYSAGMTLRLGFALVTALEPGILVMDEGFSTGDLHFTERATKRMDDFIGRSRIIVLASHSEELIKSMCNKAALMREGRLLAFGSVDEVVDQYRLMVHANQLASMGDRGAAKTLAESDAIEMSSEPPPPIYSEESIRDVGLADRLTRTNGDVRFTKAVAHDGDGKTKWTFGPRDVANVYFEYEVMRPVSELAIYFRLYRKSDNSAGQEIIADLFEVFSSDALTIGHRGGIDLCLANLKLMPGSFYLYVHFGNGPSRTKPLGSLSYDVIDTNVDLPPIRIESDDDKNDLKGCVPLEYKIRKVELPSHTSRNVGALVD